MNERMMNRNGTSPFEDGPSGMEMIFSSIELYAMGTIFSNHVEKLKSVEFKMFFSFS